jgi:formate dehydrogenase major subunit
VKLKVAEMMAKNKALDRRLVHGPDPAHDRQRHRARLCILQLALGNVGVSGGGTNIFRGHDNVQGATDVGPNPDSLPGYYGIATGSWKHWSPASGASITSGSRAVRAQALMEKSGITVSRWIDGVLEKNEFIDQDPNLRAWCSGATRRTRRRAARRCSRR